MLLNFLSVHIPAYACVCNVSLKLKNKEKEVKVVEKAGVLPFFHSVV